MYIYPPHEYSRDLQGIASEWIEDHDFDGENYWDSQEETFPHLKTVMIYGYINEPYVMQMVKFLLRSAVGLEKMIFIDAIERQKDYFNSEQLLKLSSELLSFPRSSSQAVILFS
ncbi:hypothetical protein ACJIZ3_011569 [Penstemon smallii]|uniref:FBD domain-containing protein n=1 Tax=Penstemon smallii TaxID=265156 RepID=A0ABD3UKS2_9LAMI